MHKTNRVVSHLIEIRYIYVRLQSGSENEQSIQEIHYYATISNARKNFSDECAIASSFGATFHPNGIIISHRLSLTIHPPEFRTK